MSDLETKHCVCPCGRLIKRPTRMSDRSWALRIYFNPPICKPRHERVKARLRRRDAEERARRNAENMIIPTKQADALQGLLSGGGWLEAARHAALGRDGIYCQGDTPCATQAGLRQPRKRQSKAYVRVLGANRG